MKSVQKVNVPKLGHMYLSCFVPSEYDWTELPESTQHKHSAYLTALQVAKHVRAHPRRQNARKRRKADKENTL